MRAHASPPTGGSWAGSSTRSRRSGWSARSRTRSAASRASRARRRSDLFAHPADHEHRLRRRADLPRSPARLPDRDRADPLDRQPRLADAPAARPRAPGRWDLFRIPLIHRRLRHAALSRDDDRRVPWPRRRLRPRRSWLGAPPGGRRLVGPRGPSSRSRGRPSATTSRHTAGPRDRLLDGQPLYDPGGQRRRRVRAVPLPAAVRGRRAAVRAAARGDRACGPGSSLMLASLPRRRPPSCRCGATRPLGVVSAGGVLSWPFLYSVKLGQVGPLLFLLFAIALAARSDAAGRRRDRRSRAACSSSSRACSSGGGLRGALSWRSSSASRCAPVAVLVSTLVVGIGAWHDYVDLLRRVSDPISTPKNMTFGGHRFRAGVDASTPALIQVVTRRRGLALTVFAWLRRDRGAGLLVGVSATQLVEPAPVGSLRDAACCCPSRSCSSAATGGPSRCRSCPGWASTPVPVASAWRSGRSCSARRARCGRAGDPRLAGNARLVTGPRRTSALARQRANRRPAAVPGRPRPCGRRGGRTLPALAPSPPRRPPGSPAVRRAAPPPAGQPRRPPGSASPHAGIRATGRAPRRVGPATLRVNVTSNPSWAPRSGPRTLPVPAAVVARVAFVVYLLCARYFDAGRPDFFYLADAFLHGREWLTYQPGPLRRRGRSTTGLRPVRPVPGVRPACRSSPWSGRRRRPPGSRSSTPSSRASGWLSCGASPARRRRSPADRAWLVVLFGFSTATWWVTMRGGVWHTGHLVASILTFAGLLEAYGRRRPWASACSAGPPS